MDNSNTKMYIDEYGSKVFENSKGDYHRKDGPAIERSNGDKFWYKEGKPHRIDGPAIEWSNGDKEWCKEGVWHKTDGPALERSNGNKYWFILSKYLNEKEFNSWISRIRKFV